MWICRAVLNDGTVCDTSNFDTADKCANCNAPRQAPVDPGFDPGLDPGVLGTKLAEGAKSVGEKAKEYAPVAAGLAKAAAAKASNIGLHSRLVAQTGVHPLSVIAFSAVLLIASMALPVALGWPMQLTITNRTDRHSVSLTGGAAEVADEAAPVVRDDAPKFGKVSSAGAPPVDGVTHGHQRGLDQHNEQPAVDGGEAPAATDPAPQGERLEGAKVTTHEYDGVEQVYDFAPNQLAGKLRTPMMFASLLAGPILITGSTVSMTGRGTDAEGGAQIGTVVLSLANAGRVFWISVLVLILAMLVADLLVGDIYAMQKLLFILVLVWIAYCVLVGMAAQYMIKDMAAELFPDLNLDLTVNGLMTAPVKIMFVGLIYWMSSMLLRNLSPKRTKETARSAI